MNATLRSVLAAVCGLFAAALVAPAQAAPAAAVPVSDAITFDQYRDWRLHFIDQRQTEIAAQLADRSLGAAQRQSLERQEAYYDRFAAMDPSDRDRLFRRRFDEIDTNHDGFIEPAERAAWHDKQQAYYATRRTASAEDVAHR